MKKLRELWKTAWGKALAISAIISTIIGWSMDISMWWSSEVNYFIKHSKIERVEVSDNKLVVTYHTAPLPNVNYRTEYWLSPVSNFRKTIKLDYADTIVKNQFPQPIYETYTKWTGDGIPLPELESGEYIIFIKYYFKGHEEVIMEHVNFSID